MQKRKKQILLICLDLDGTLFNHKKEITPHTLDVLQQAMDQGVYIAPVTGRPSNGLPAALMSLPRLRYAVTSNGARVMDLAANQALAQFPMDPAITAETLRILQRYDCIPSLFCDGERMFNAKHYADLPRYVQPNMLEYLRTTGTPVEDLVDYALHCKQCIEKVTAFFQDTEERGQAWNELEKLSCGLAITSSLKLNIEINAPGINKGRAMMALAAHLGLGREHVMACGDSGNDLTMIRMAGLGVAMGNSTPEILDAADYVTLTNEQDGVAAAIERFVL